MKGFLLLALLGLATPAQAFDHRPAVESFRHELQDMDRYAIAARADEAMDNMVMTGIHELKRFGHRVEALRMENEWKPLRGTLFRMVYEERETPEQWAPLSVALSDFYHTIKANLGETMTVALHLDDLQVMNWGTGVVFHMEVIGQAQPTAAEYELYFNPWCGVVSYWTVWSLCTGATWGTGAFVICTPAAMLAEELTFYVIAPRFSDEAWAYFY